ncbi:MAG TPA: TonB-dependent receptor [Polyangiaceae bacterium]|nr:TonB-dependent receptor [Polyangiaceae bacterium]
MRRWLGWIGSLALCTATLGSAQAQAPRADDTAPAQVRAPEPIESGVDYPKGATGDAEVVLELVVEADGSVSASRSVSGTEPFAEAARTASLGWRFAPARRGDQAVRARIRFAVHFEERAEVHAAGTVEAPRTAGAAHDAPVEIEVHGERPHPVATSFTRAEARQLPGAFGDPTRTLDMMPGVSPIVSALPLFFIRGAPPGNVGFFIDGVRIPLLYHVFLGPSVVHPGMIERVDLYAAAYPANFGRFAGAIVSAKLVEPRRQLGGEASVRLLDSGALVEAPFDGGRGSAIVGGRYSYTGLIVSAISGNELKYWDYQGLVSYDLTPKSSLSLFAFGALDYVDAGAEDVGGTAFHRIDLRLDHDFSSQTEARVAATWGFDKTLSDVGYVSDRMLTGRGHVEHRADSVVTLRTGFDVAQDRYELDIEPAASEKIVYETLFPTRTDLALGLYAEMLIAPSDWYSVTPAIRTDIFRSLGTTRQSVDPRVTASFQVYDPVRLFHAVGLAHQTPNFVPAIPGAQVAGLSNGLQRTVHTTSGVELSGPEATSLTVAYFQNAYFDLTDPAGLNQSLDIDEDSADTRATGHAYGLEFHLKRPLARRLGGVLSYTLSRTTRSYDRVSTLSAYDRPHVVNAAAVYKLGAGWQAGARLAFASGIPGAREAPPDKVYDQSRSRPYARLDLKVEKRWQLSPTSWWGVHAEVLNATAGTEVLRRNCRETGCEDVSAPPLVLPSIGVEAAF